MLTYMAPAQRSESRAQAHPVQVLHDTSSRNVLCTHQEVTIMQSALALASVKCQCILRELGVNEVC